MDIKEELIIKVAKELNIKEESVIKTLELLNDDCTVPFIARYRKEVTSGLDENQIREIEKLYNYQINLDAKKESIKNLINEKGLLTDELKNKIDSCEKLIELEDIYRPFKEKKKTKASIGIEMGLLDLAKFIMTCPKFGNPLEIINKYVNEKTKNEETVIENVKYIIAEIISDNANYRSYIRDHALNYGKIVTKKKKDTDPEEKYKVYYDKEFLLKYIKSYQVLAINRAEDEKVLTVNVILQPERDVDYLKYKVIFRETIFKDILEESIKDSYQRLIAPAISREIRSILKEKADIESIEVFKKNLKPLIMQKPLKDMVVLGIDPAYRTGCKYAVIDEIGKVLTIGVIYPNERKENTKANQDDVLKSKKTIIDLIKKYHVNLIVIGNGTAGRETEVFVADIINENKLDVKYAMVSEAGASVYSASDVAIEEFPDLSLEKRSAISIARRCEDAMSELCKIDPKSIGVGEYQHDVDQNMLSDALDNVMIDAVNSVGVDLNRASYSLLSYVSGLNKTISKNIIEYREQNGGFKNRKELNKVKKLGPKAYLMCAGFLRIRQGEEPLDMTGIHPESYKIAEKLLKKVKLDKSDIGKDYLKDALDNLNKDELLKELDTDIYTLNIIIDGLTQPLRDERDTYPGLNLRSNIMSFEDLKIGDDLDGIVRSILPFGLFIDLGVKYNGLLHISETGLPRGANLLDKFTVGDNLHVYVKEIDYDKHKLSLSLKNN